MLDHTIKAKIAPAPTGDVRKFDYIDALRGVAVLLVVLAHTPVPDRLLFFNVVGAYGVPLFFVISAFTLFLSMSSRTKRDSAPILFFFIRRFFRIAPAFYLAIAFYLVWNGVGGGPWALDGIHGWQVAATALFVHGWFPHAMNAVVPGGWSIADEMNFYLFVPLCFMFVTNAYRAFLLGAMLAGLAVALDALILPGLLAPYANEPTIMYWFPRLWFPAEACIFPIGFALFFLCDRITGNMHNTYATWGVLGGAAVIAVVLWKLHLAQSLFVAAVGIGILVYGVAVLKPWPIVNPVIEYIGKISFSVYLFQFCIIDLVERYLMPLWQGVNPYTALLLFFGTVTGLTCIVATVTHRYVEEPGQALGNAVIRRFVATRQLAA